MKNDMKQQYKNNGENKWLKQQDNLFLRNGVVTTALGAFVEKRLFFLTYWTLASLKLNLVIEVLTLKTVQLMDQQSLLQVMNALWMEAFQRFR